MVDTFRAAMGKYLIDRIDDDIMWKKFLDIIIELILVVFVGSGFLQILESMDYYDPNEGTYLAPKQLEFFELVYFIQTSIAVVGYGSTITSDQSQIFLFFYLLITFAIVPVYGQKIV
jgi:hypothetical protein